MSEARVSRVVLASQSPSRLSVLRAAGVEPLVRVSGVDEEAVVAALEAHSEGRPTPSEIVCAQAKAKAIEVAGRFLTELEELPETADLYLVVGCDSMLEIDGVMLGKPGTPEVARQRIRSMRGGDSTLWTGHAVAQVSKQDGRWTLDGVDTAAASTLIHFGWMSEEEIDAYVATGEPLDKAGSFTIDGLGGPFIQGVSGDPHSVVGLSLPLLRGLFAAQGVFWPDLWNGETGRL